MLGVFLSCDFDFSLTCQDFVLEGLFLLILLALVGVFFWLGREIWLLRSQPPAPQGPSELIIPSGFARGGAAKSGKLVSFKVESVLFCSSI